MKNLIPHNHNFKKTLVFFLTVCFLCVHVSLAQGGFDCSRASDTIAEPQASDALIYLLCPLQSAIWIGVFLVGSALIIFILYGGIKALMSTGDARQLEGAKSVWTYAIFGALVILLAIFIIQIIFALLGSDNDPLSITGTVKNSFDSLMNRLSPTTTTP